MTYDPNISPAMNRLRQLTAELFPPTDEYGVKIPVIKTVDEKLGEATELIAEAKATLAVLHNDNENKADAVIDDAKMAANKLVADAKIAAELLLAKAAAAAEAVLEMAKKVRDSGVK